VVPEHDPVYKVTIIPRGRALGVTMFLPEQDRYSLSQASRSSQPDGSLFGGRVAEEMTLRGRSRDHRRVQRHQACHRDGAQHGRQVGPLREMGPMTYDEDEDEVFLGRSVTQHKHMSDETARLIDEEVRRHHRQPWRRCARGWGSDTADVM
jgi:cell division protease FtsH